MADIHIIISLSAYSYAAILGEFRSRTLIFNIWAQKRFFIIIIVIFKAVYPPQFFKKSTFGELRRPEVTNL